MLWFWKAKMAVDRTTSKVVDLVEADPAGWVLDKCEAVHSSGVRVWTANEDYGIKVYTTESGWAKDAWVPGMAERKLIWHVFQKLIAVQTARNERRVEKLINKALDAAHEQVSA